MSLDRVFIQGLEVETIIGIYEHERENKQRIVFDIEMAYDNRPAANSDDIADALDYHRVSERVIELAQGGYLLVERLAEIVADTVMREFNVLGITVRLSKPEALAYTASVGVKISRGCLSG